jgi:hypothetical protein
MIIMNLDLGDHINLGEFLFVAMIFGLERVQVR